MNFGQEPVFIPGPTNIPDRLRAAMNRQTRDHRAPDFIDLLAPVLKDARKVFKTEQGRVHLFPSSGTGGWEAAITNTLSPGDKVLAVNHGMFSNRWIDMCRRHGLDVVEITRPWGEAAPLDAMAEVLQSDTTKQIKAVLVTHNETATGVRSDIAGIRQALDAAQHPALILADVVSSLASMDFRMDEWGVDIAVSGSQKGFMLTTGMAIVAVSPKALAMGKTAKLPRTFFSFDDMGAANDKGGYPYTPPVQLIYGLRESLDMLAEEGLDNVFARHHRLAEGVRRAVGAWGLEMVATDPKSYSDSVTAIRVPDGFDSDKLLHRAVTAYGMSFGGGLGQLAGKVFRIGHLGALSEPLVLSGIATIEMAMADLAFPIKLGSGVAAAQDYFTGAAAKPVSRSNAA